MRSRIITEELNFAKDVSTLRMDIGAKPCTIAFSPKVSFFYSNHLLKFHDNSIMFLCAENKRKCNDSPSNFQIKTKRFEANSSIDLIVLGLPWQLSELQLREYFQSYGSVKMAMVRLHCKEASLFYRL